MRPPDRNPSPEYEADERIKAAARELASALTAGGGTYAVVAEIIDVTGLSDGRERHAYSVRVIERFPDRRVAP